MINLNITEIIKKINYNTIISIIKNIRNNIN